MKLDTAKAAVEFLLKNSEGSDCVKISFFGGEPLVRFDLIREVVSYAKKRASMAGKSVKPLAPQQSRWNETRVNAVVMRKQATFSTSSSYFVLTNIL